MKDFLKTSGMAAAGVATGIGLIALFAHATGLINPPRRYAAENPQPAGSPPPREARPKSPNPRRSTTKKKPAAKKETKPKAKPETPPAEEAAPPPVQETAPPKPPTRRKKTPEQ